MPTLFDHLGRPIEQKRLRDEQGAPQLAGVRNYYELQSYRSVSPVQLANMLRAAAEGDLSGQSRLFEDMEEKDGHIFAEMSKRKRALTGLPWTVLPADESGPAADQAAFVSQTLARLNLEDILFDACDAFGKGFSCLEIIWDLSSGQAQVQDVVHRPQNWFQHPQNSAEIRLADGSMDGEPLIPFKWFVHRHKAKSGNPWRCALYRVLAWYYLFRNYDLKAWAQWLEGFGLPLRLGHYPLGTPEADQEKLLSALAALATNACAVVPDGMDIEIIEQAKQASTSMPHQGFLDWSGRVISVAILGQTLTTDTQGVGSQALGQVHNDVRLDILRSDARQVETSLGRDVIRPLVDLNFGPQQAYPCLRLELPDEEDKTALAGNISTLAAAGFKKRIPVWWIHERFGIPEPKEGELTLGDVAPAAPLDSPESKQPAKNRRAAPVFTPDQAALEGLKTAVETNAEADAEELVAPLLEILSQCSTYDEAKARLSEAFPEPAGVSSRLARAIFSARAWGHVTGE